jgi:putative ABC transport system substrate-binding protein
VTRSRRRFLLAAGALMAAPPGSFAQPAGKIWRIGFISTYPRSENAEWSDAFKAGMRALGHAEGRDYSIEYRYAEGDLQRLPALVAELIALKVDLIHAASSVSAIAARKLTREIPIVIATAADPVASGMAASLARPGGNVTGLTALGSELLPKRLELMRQVLPAVRQVGIIHNPDSPIDLLLVKQFQSAAEKLEIKAVAVVLRHGDDVPAAFRGLVAKKVGAIMVSSTLVNVSLRASLVEQAAKNGLPGMYGSGEFVQLGGLMSYSPNYGDQYRRSAGYVDSILKGAKPGDLPIEQPTKFELVVNMKTAKALGVRIPNSVLLRADRVIE